MHWDGRVGPTFIVTVGLALVSALFWLTDGKAALSERLAVVETTIGSISRTVGRLETKVDTLTQK